MNKVPAKRIPRITWKLADKLRGLIPSAIRLYLPAWLPKWRLWRNPLKVLAAKLWPKNMAPINWRSFIPRRLTPEEKVEYKRLLAEHQAAEKERKRLGDLANKCVAEITRALTNKGICFRIKDREDKREITRRVKFCRPYLTNHDEIHIKVSAKKMPRGIGYEHFVETPLLAELLSDVCQRKVSIRYDKDNAASGLWLTIELNVGAGGIPTHVLYEEVIAQRPVSLAKKSFAVPIGVGKGKQVYWLDIGDDDNYLIAGTTRQGKTTCLKVILSTLLLNNPPSRFKMMLFDLKRGVAMQRYWRDPHLLEMEWEGEKRPAIVFEPDMITPALRYLFNIGQARLDQFHELGIEKISNYNQLAHQRGLPYMSRIYLVIDELALLEDLMKPRKRFNEAMGILQNILNLYLSCGIHVITATQSPNAKLIEQAARNGYGCKIVFGVTSQSLSQTLVNSWRATYITTKGRFLLVNGMKIDELQCPYISDEMADKYAEMALVGQELSAAPKKAHDVEDHEILHWAIMENNGYLGRDAIYNKFRERGLSKKFAEQFGKHLEGKTVMVDEEEYLITPPGHLLPNPTARRLVSTKLGLTPNPTAQSLVSTKLDLTPVAQSPVAQPVFEIAPPQE